MHEGHHGILDGLDDKPHDDHNHEDVSTCRTCSGETVKHQSNNSSRTLKNTLGIIALSIILIFVFRLLFS